MKKRMLITTAAVTIALLILGACAPQAQPETPAASEAQPAAATEAMPEPTQAPAATEAMPEPTAATEMAEPAAPEMDVEALIIEKVAGNHDVERIFNAVKTREEWEETLDRMIGYGAKISEEEKQIMIDYLLSRQQ